MGAVLFSEIIGCKGILGLGILGRLGIVGW